MTKKQILIGTSGHIDHGKTSLVKALTGIDTDSLKEEKKRGITIETGIAHWDDFIPDTQITFLDVPGHEKLVKNMIAGVQSIDLFMLIVAADDGKMPQTEEHIDILNLLNINEGLVVITKTDLVEPDWLELVKEEVDTLIQNCFNSKKNIICVDSLSGNGLTELKDQLKFLLEKISKRKWHDNFIMPVDKIFPVQGYGHIFRGTIEGGELQTNDKVQFYPSDIVGRVRYIQSHKAEIELVSAGARAGVNISDVKMENIPHEMVLAKPGSLVTSKYWWLSIKTLPKIKRLVKHMDQVHFLQGTRHLIGKIRLYKDKVINQNTETIALLELADEQPFMLNDRFIIRQFSPTVTIAGGKLLFPAEKLIRKKYYTEIDNPLTMLSQQNVLENSSIEFLLNISYPKPLKMKFLSSLTGLNEKTLRQFIKSNKNVSIANDFVFSINNKNKIKDELISFAETYFSENPKMGEVALSVFNNNRLENNELKLYISQFSTEINLIIENEMIYPSELKPELKSQINSIIKWQKEQCKWIFSSDEIREKLNITKAENIHFLNQLEKLNYIKRAASGQWILMENYKKLLGLIQDFFAKNPQLSIGDFKELTNSSRKEAIPLLELLDEEKITKRDENMRLAGEKL
ncbi:MAG: selenocysteine-specific translation elongation factor [Calditrichia bacterium]|nr:selenocysteine-specific translation elongation factor [Calditrichia bacterium]